MLSIKAALDLKAEEKPTAKAQSAFKSQWNVLCSSCSKMNENFHLKKKKTNKLSKPGTKKATPTKPSASLAFCILQPPVKGVAMYTHDAPFLHVAEFSTQNIWSLIVYLGKRLLHVFLLFHLQIMFLADTGCENYNGLNFEGCVLSPSWFCRHNACLPCLFLFSLAMLLFVGEIYTRLIKLMGWKSLAVGIVSCIHLDPVLPVPYAQCPHYIL